jgi:hypothetical protein
MTLSARVRKRRNGIAPDIDFESGAADRPAFATNKERIEFYEHFTDDRPEKVLRHRAGHYPQQVVIAVALATLIVGLPASIFACRKMSIAIFAGKQTARRPSAISRGGIF